MDFVYGIDRDGTAVQTEVQAITRPPVMGRGGSLAAWFEIDRSQEGIQSALAAGFRLDEASLPDLGVA
ncbi:hypothetical protein JQ604_25865 [Bradyrhizobium jicamae]|uniref:hypothetical protein n=1 Tax=Bradyrhizobium jicamae TaxID=280332 RepID=UPI001BAE5399|nr:hypothetical protein [Bradyrhizobium jicamae]MBR0755620.1 hypothetical protein [Bradyrhizobium jicamae]